MNGATRKRRLSTNLSIAAVRIQRAPRGEISAADLLRAFAAIRPTEEEKAVIAGLLGFAWAADKPTPIPQVDETPKAQFEPLPKVHPPKPVMPIAATPVIEPQSGTSLRLEGPTPLKTIAPPWLESRAVPVPVRRRELPEPKIAPPSLFFPKWIPTIIASSVATPDLDAPIDVSRLVECVTSGKILTEIPRLRRGTLARGVQVFLDTSENMLPFRFDQRAMVQHLERMCGRFRMQLIEFKGTPFQVSRRRARGESPPQTELRPGVPVLLLSDLGIGGRLQSSSVHSWLAFVGLARNAGCHITAFVPYGKSRWPRPLKRVMRLIVWDRH